MAWRRADDVRALLATCLLRTVPEELAETLQLILDVYADEEVTRASGHELHLGIAAPAHLPPRSGGVVVSVFPGDRPLADTGSRLTAPVNTYRGGNRSPPGKLKRRNLAPAGRRSCAAPNRLPARSHVPANDSKHHEAIPSSAAFALAIRSFVLLIAPFTDGGEPLGPALS